MRTAKFQTETGTITLTDEGITVPKTAGTKGDTFGKWASLVGQTRTIPFGDVHSVAVGDPKARYVTGGRAAVVVATGGLGLILPRRTRATLAIATTDGEVLEFTLLRKDAKRSDAVALAFSARGVTVV